MAYAFKKLHWTEHSKLKMRQYGLSKMKLLNLMRKPERKERGIAAGTMAVMQTNKKYGKAASAKGFGAPKGEIWLMYKDNNPSTGSGQAIRKIISTWRYPGISKPGDSIPIPQDILDHIENEPGNI